MSFWDKVKIAATKAGDATKLAAHKTRLRTEMIMIDRDINGRKQTFGIMMSIPNLKIYEFFSQI